MRVLAVVFVGLLVSACALGRSTVDIGDLEQFSNPQAGIAVKFSPVKDVRHFQISPPSPDIPSLSESGTNSQEIKARAIARKRNGFGKALGDVVLPDGKTVSHLVGEAVENAFRSAGYRTLKAGDAGYNDATTIQTSLVEFWSWFQPGFWAVTVHNKAEVTIEAPISGLRDGIVIKTRVMEKMAAVTESDWGNSARNGLIRLSEEIAARLKSIKQEAKK